MLKILIAVLCHMFKVNIKYYADSTECYHHENTRSEQDLHNIQSDIDHLHNKTKKQIFQKHFSKYTAH